MYLGNKKEFESKASAITCHKKLSSILLIHISIFRLLASTVPANC